MSIAIWDQDDKTWHYLTVAHGVFSEWLCKGSIIRTESECMSFFDLPPTLEEVSDAFTMASEYQEVR